MAVGSPEWEFTIHGINAHVQNELDPNAPPEELEPFAIEPDPEDIELRRHRPSRSPSAQDFVTNPRRTTDGTTIRQDGGDNWFHLAITTPAPQMADRGDLYCTRFFCWGRVNEPARVRFMQLWRGGGQKTLFLCEDDTVNQTGQDFEMSCKWSGVQPSAPLLISIYVEFDNGGEITIGGAGVGFEEIEY